MAHFSQVYQREWFSSIELLKEVKNQLECDPADIEIDISSFNHMVSYGREGFYLEALINSRYNPNNRTVCICARDLDGSDEKTIQEYKIRYEVVFGLNRDKIQEGEFELPEHVKETSFENISEAARAAVNWLLNR